jgi:hypothetical protein
MPYEYQEFPKWKYHPTLPGRIVKNDAEEKALGKGWYNRPDDAAKAAEPFIVIRVLDHVWKSPKRYAGSRRQKKLPNPNGLGRSEET